MKRAKQLDAGRIKLGMHAAVKAELSTKLVPRMFEAEL
jgi:hypothetical protein